MTHRTRFREALEAYIAFSGLQDGTEEAKARAELLFDDADYRGVNFYGTKMRSREDVDSFRNVLAEIVYRIAADGMTANRRWHYDRRHCHDDLRYQNEYLDCQTKA